MLTLRLSSLASCACPNTLAGVVERNTSGTSALAGGFELPARVLLPDRKMRYQPHSPLFARSLGNAGDIDIIVYGSSCISAAVSPIALHHLLIQDASGRDKIESTGSMEDAGYLVEESVLRI